MMIACNGDIDILQPLPRLVICKSNFVFWIDSERLQIRLYRCSFRPAAICPFSHYIQDESASSALEVESQ